MRKTSLTANVTDVPSLELYQVSELAVEGDTFWKRDPDRAHRAFQRAAELLDNVPPGVDAASNTWRFRQVNLLATCPDPEVRDPARALQIAQTLKDDPQFQGAFGIALFANARYAEARKQLEEYLATRPYSNTLDLKQRAYLAMSMFHLGDVDSARAELAVIEHTLRSHYDIPWTMIPFCRQAWKLVTGEEMPDLWKKP